MQKNQVTADDVADYFIALANETGDVMTNLKLQKMVYYAQAWYLANKKTPLFDDEFQAWVHGPVIPTLYREYKGFGARPIVKNILMDSARRKLGEEISRFLDDVAEVYMPHGAYSLEMMTHREDPWINARKGCEPDDVCDVVISKDEMREFYGKKIKN